MSNLYSKKVLVITQKGKYNNKYITQLCNLMEAKEMYLKPKSEAIASKRTELKLSRYALSKKAGLGKYAIARMEEGSHSVHPLRAKAVADALGCSINDLFESTKTDLSLIEAS
jgi:DNA-binding XRE family transcriptional regulator